jgi:hypothetical protein
MVIMEKSPNENPVLLVLLGLIQIPIVWWFRSRDRQKQMEIESVEIREMFPIEEE